MHKKLAAISTAAVAIAIQTVLSTLTSAEQAALAAGATGTIVAVLSKNPLTVGLVTTIVSVAAAEGICSKHRQLRIYIPSFLMSECI